MTSFPPSQGEDVFTYFMLKILVKKFLKYLVKKILRKYNPDVIGITGSMGKTSVKQIAVGILRNKFKVRASFNSYNTLIGLALTVIGKKSPNRSVWGWLSILSSGFKLIFKKNPDYPEVLILEIAANKPGDLKKVMEMIDLDVGVVTAIGPTHLEFFKTMKKVAQEKRRVISSLSKTGVAILNRDDSEVYEMRSKTGADILTFGFHPDADVRASDVNFKIDQETGKLEGMIFKLIYKGNVVPVFLPGIIGEHIIYPSLAAIAIALAQGVNLVEISQSLQNVLMPPGRMRLLAGIKGTLLIDDSYNASLAPMRSALETLAQCSIKPGGEKYAVLGDMLELGASTTDSHREVGLRVAEAGVDFFITVGEAMKAASRAAQEGGLDERQIASFNNSQEAGKFLQEKLKSNDIVLIKGSRAMRMERVVKEVMAKPERAGELLVAN